MNKTLITQFGMRYGLILGLISVISGVLFFIAKPESKWIESVLGFVVLIAVLYQALKKFREQNNDTLSIGEGMRVGFWVSLISGTISSVYKYLEITFLNPEELAQQLKIQKIALEDSGMPEDQIDMAMKLTAQMMEPYILIPMGIFWSILFVGIISLIISAILKKERSVFD
jgi:hypothetical protein